jgi:hypothetical protein
MFDNETTQPRFSLVDHETITHVAAQHTLVSLIDVLECVVARDRVNAAESIVASSAPRRAENPPKSL